MAQGYPEYSDAILRTWKQHAPSFTQNGLPPQTWELYELGCTVEQFEAALLEALADKSIPRRKCADQAVGIVRARLKGKR